MDTGSEDKLGRKARILDGRAATVVDHYTGTFLGDSVEMLTLRLDMAEDVATYGRADFEMLASDVDFSDGPVLIRSERIRVILPLSDWVTAVTSARRGKDERSAEVAARGHVLGIAAMTLEHRRAAQAPMVLPSDDAVVDAAVRVRNIEAFGFDPQSLDRLRRGLGPTGRAVSRPQMTCASFSATLDETRNCMMAQAEKDRQRHADLGAGNLGWEIWEAR